MKDPYPEVFQVAQYPPGKIDTSGFPGVQGFPIFPGVCF